MAFLEKHIFNFTRNNITKFARYFSTSRHLAQDKIVTVAEELQSEAEQYTPKDYALLLRKNREIQRKNLRPFARDFFVGSVETELLSFPEVLDREEVVNLEKYAARVKQIMKEAKGQSLLERRDLLAELQQMGLFGLTIPQEYGGQGATMTEYATLAEEFGIDSNLMAILNPHLMLAAQTLITEGTPEQKELYLPRMASGELLATFCYREPDIGSDMTQTTCQASNSLDGRDYTIEGQKYWVPNGPSANLFFTVASTQSQSHLQKQKRMTTFIVERGQEVQVTPMEDLSGLKLAGYSTVDFKKTQVSEIHLLGKQGEGMANVHEVFAFNRFSTCASVLGKLKHLRRMCIDHMLHTQRFGKYLCRFDSLLTMLSRIHLDIYLLESSLYFTAGIMDISPPDAHHIENALLMALCRDIFFKSIYIARQIMGVDALKDSHPCQQVYRDVQTLFFTETSDNLLRIYAALVGSVHVGNTRVNEIKAMRNRFMNPLTAIKTLLKRDQKMNSFSTQLDLAGYVHPTLMPLANQLDRTVVKFEIGVLEMLERYTRNMLDHEMDQVRLGEVAMYAYGLMACLSRSSRSYCTGLHNAYHEVNTTQLLATELIPRLDNLLDIIHNGEATHMDSLRMQHANTLLQIGDQYHERPFQYNN